MKKVIKLLIPMVVIIILFGFCNSNAAYNKNDLFSVTLNPKQDNSNYKSREINIFGFKFIYEDEMFFSGENNTITDEQKNINNIIIGVFSAILVIYWIVLLFIYEREDSYDDYTYENNDDIKTLRKYNPMLAGCLVDNRQVLSRDVTAVILNLIQKQVINMEMIPKLEGKDDYAYMISENKDSVAELDEIERYVLNWIFGFYEQEKVDLIEKLKELSRRKDFLKNMKKLNSIAQRELNNKGANISRVPSFVKMINFFLVVFSIVMATVHIISNGLNVHIYQTTILLIYLVAIAIIIVLPVVALIIHLMLLAAVIFKRFIKSVAEKYSGKKIVSTSILILLLMLVLILAVYFMVPSKYICLDIFMIGMAILIVKTDNLMTKHNKEVLNDYYSLNEIKYKIKEYSLIKDEQINYIKLWEEYLVYAVAFGIPIPIVNKLKQTYKEDEDIKYLLKCENLYYVCKAYLEVMWEMEFKEKKQKYNIADLFRIERKINL